MAWRQAGTIGGGALRQISRTNGQRGAKRHPGGSAAMFGTMPSMAASSASLLIEPRHRAEQADRVGMLRTGKQHIDRRAFDDLARIHDRDLVAHLGDDAEIVGDEDDGRAG